MQNFIFRTKLKPIYCQFENPKPITQQNPHTPLAKISSFETWQNKQKVK
jgi:hypothetical protein